MGIKKKNNCLQMDQTPLYIELARLILVSFENAHDRPDDLKGRLDSHFKAGIIAKINSISKPSAQHFLDKINHHIRLLQPEIYTLTPDDQTRLNLLILQAENIATMINGARYCADDVLDNAYKEDIYNGYWPNFRGRADDERLNEFRDALIHSYERKKIQYGNEDIRSRTNTVGKLERVYSRLKEKFRELYKVPLYISKSPHSPPPPGTPANSKLNLSKHILKLNDALSELQLKVLLRQTNPNSQR